MKFLLITVMALIGFAAAAQLPDSATQGPNPQDIATPEPEYIDIDLPEPSRPAAPAPAPVQQFAPVPRPVVQRPIQQAPVYRAPAPAPAPVYHAAAAQIAQRAQYLPPLAQQAPQQQLSGHAYNAQSGYQYRRPVYVRRFYRHRRY